MLPARTITIAPAAGATIESAVVDSERAIVVESLVDGSAINPEVAIVNSNNTAIWIAVVALLAVGWAATTLILLRKLQSVSKSRSSKIPKPQKQNSIKKLRAAIASGDSADVKDALLLWAVETWPSDPPRTLTALAVRLDDARLSARLRALDEVIYAQQADKSTPDLFDVVELLGYWRKQQKQAASKVEVPALPDF